MTAAVGWGALAASSLILGALVGLVRPWPDRAVGLVLAFGAGALISAVSFDLAEEGAQIGDPGYLGLGLAGGALTYFVANRAVERIGGRRRSAPSAPAGDGGLSLALGAFLDGIPEQLVLGISLAAGDGISVGLLAAIFISNLPESVGSATEMRAAGRTPGSIAVIWILVAAICALASVVGFGIADSVSNNFQATIDGFAAGALLVMLIDSMIPEARRRGGDVAGVVTVLGFAVAAALSSVG